MNLTADEKTADEKTQVGVTIPTAELAEMKSVTCVDLSSAAVLALARKGLAAEKAKIAAVENSSAPTADKN